MPELSDKQKLIRLSIEGDPDNSGTTRKGVFEFAQGSDVEPLSVTEEVRTQTRGVTGSGTFLTIFEELAGDQFGGNEVNKSIVLNLGNGQFSPQVTGVITADQRRPDGQPCQWGDTGDDSKLTKTDATGAHPLVKSQVLNYWFRNTRTSSAPNLFEIDGAGPAELEYGEYRSDADALYDPLKVVMESPQITVSSDASATGRLSATFVEVADLGEAIDAVQNDTR